MYLFTLNPKTDRIDPKYKDTIVPYRTSKIEASEWNIWRLLETSVALAKIVDYNLASARQNQQIACAQRRAESLLIAQHVAKDPNFLHADSEDSD